MGICRWLRDRATADPSRRPARLTARVQHPIITTDAELRDFCRRLAHAPSIGFDTEFVAEHTYRPVLCLVQVAAGDHLALIDSLAVHDLTPFWELLAAPHVETVVHAGRQEFLFCLDAIGRRPARLFDVQLAAGLVGLEYPAGYGSLIGRLLGQRPQKGETRTDWRKRPLTERQLEYALDDVRYLAPLRAAVGDKLTRLHRWPWFEAEMAGWQQDIDASRGGERWRRVAGSASLAARSLAIVRELWAWREREADRRNLPVRQILRDDLLVEMAKRRSADPKQIGAVRGMERGDLRRAVPDMAKVIAQALALPEKDCPSIVRGDSSPQLNMLGQFLSSALTSICRDADVAASLVGTASDVRELVAWRMGERNGDNTLPALAQGWRAEVVGHLLEDLLAGTVAIRIGNPRAEQPLVFEPTTAAKKHA